MSENSPTLEQVLTGMTEDKAVAFVRSELKDRDVWVISRDGRPENVPTLLMPNAVLLTVEKGQVVKVEYARPIPYGDGSLQKKEPGNN